MFFCNMFRENERSNAAGGSSIDEEVVAIQVFQSAGARGAVFFFGQVNVCLPVFILIQSRPF
jgi:hypothetical protein